MGTLKLEIPEDVLGSLRIPPDEVEDELRKELAVALYERKALSLGKARHLARMSRWEFHELLGKRKVVRHYEIEDLEGDLEYVRSNP
jgi:predicted HTH domain antitoxin